MWICASLHPYLGFSARAREKDPCVMLRALDHQITAYVDNCHYISVLGSCVEVFELCSVDVRVQPSSTLVLLSSSVSSPVGFVPVI